MINPPSFRCKTWRLPGTRIFSVRGGAICRSLTFPAVAGCSSSGSPTGRLQPSQLCEKGVSLMFVRTVDCHVKPGKQDELSHKLRQWKVLPILQKQAGFVDVIGLVSENDPELLRSLTFWKVGERRRGPLSPRKLCRILENVRPLLKRRPTIEVSAPWTLRPRTGLSPARRLDPRPRRGPCGMGRERFPPIFLSAPRFFPVLHG